MEKIELTDEHKKFIDDNYKRINDLNELTNAVFMGEGLDGRTKEGRAVRKYMASKDYKYKTRKITAKLPPVVLTQDQCEFILANADGKMKALDMAKILYPEKNIAPLSKETQAISNFLKSNAPQKINPRESAVSEKYKPVKTFSEALKLVNESTSQNLQEGKLQAQVKKGIEALIGFLQAPRLIQTISNYTDKQDRALFQAEFIRATWDKPDLTSDEVNLYINVCIDYINLMNIQKAIDKLNHMFEECEDQRDMTVRLAELLKTKSDEYNQCEKRMESLITRLNGDRAKRVQNKQSQNASILNLVQLFQEEEEREVMVKIAEMQKALVEEEAANIESMPDWKARVLGLRKGDVA